MVILGQVRTPPRASLTRFQYNQTFAQDFFETCAILITVVILGKYLECSAKGRTSDAIKVGSRHTRCCLAALHVTGSGIEPVLHASVMRSARRAATGRTSDGIKVGSTHTGVIDACIKCA